LSFSSETERHPIKVKLPATHYPTDTKHISHQSKPGEKTNKQTNKQAHRKQRVGGSTILPTPGVSLRRRRKKKKRWRRR
jgi:hypothetical protein